MLLYPFLFPKEKTKSVYLSNKRCEVNKDGSRKGHIEVNAKAEVPLGYDGIIEYEVKKANGKVASGKCRITNNNGVVNVCGPSTCFFYASNDNSGVVCIPSGNTIDFIYDIGDELFFSAVSGSIGVTKALVDSGENGVPSSGSSDAGKSLVVGSDGAAYWDACAGGDNYKRGLPSYGIIGAYNLNSSKTHVYLPIAKHKDAGSQAFHIQGLLYIAQHVNAAIMGIINITGRVSGNPYGVYNCSVQIICHTTNKYSGGASINPRDLVNVELCQKSDAQNWLTLGLHVTAKSEGNTPRVSLSNVVTDEDTVPLYAVTFNEGSSEEIASWTDSTTATWEISVPCPTTEDNGKILKVVDGKPSWASE